MVKYNRTLISGRPADLLQEMTNMQWNLVNRAGSYAMLTALLAWLVSTPSWGQSTIWHVKAVHPDGHLLRVKAIDDEGGIHDVKAIEQAGNAYLLDVKALVGGEVLSVKVLQSDDWFGPVKAIRADGSYLDIKALTEEGQRLDVKAVSRAGHVLDIKAISDDHQFFGVKAVSPAGRVYDIKGLKMNDDDVEMHLGETPIRAHVKALPQTR
jgi:hypothetical protein